MIRRHIREWSSLPFRDEGEDAIPEAVAVRLRDAAARLSLGGKTGSSIISLEHKAMRAGQVVGVLSAEDCSLEILPKIEGINEGGVRARLVHMLNVAFGLDIDSSGISSLGWQRNDLLEILILLFAQKLRNAVRQGMPRRYVAHEEDLPMLRGRLNVIRQFTRYAAAPEQLACRYDELSPDIALNQIMKAAITKLSHMARSIESQRLLRELQFEYAEITEIPPLALRWGEIILDRTNHRWRELLELAKLLLGEHFQNTISGEQSGFSLLFPMNVLFETYIARMIDRAVRPSGLKTIFQGGRRYCLHDISDGSLRFQTKPDILIHENTMSRLIVDTKWKTLIPALEDPKNGISQADIYQMIAYGKIYDCPRLLLLYPHTSKLGPEGVQRRYRITKSEQELLIATVDVGNSLNMAGRIQKIIMECETEHSPEAVAS